MSTFRKHYNSFYFTFEECLGLPCSKTPDIIKHIIEFLNQLVWIGYMFPYI